MRAWCVVASLLCVGALWAQYPTVFFGARVNLQARADERTTALRWYDDLARHSVVYLQLYHEAGYGAYVAQRLQNLGGDRTRTGLDEAYIERLEGWRVGKFYAPFGAGTAAQRERAGGAIARAVRDWRVAHARGVPV
jgi:hypothetical protein